MATCLLRAARVIKKAVNCLLPFMEAEKRAKMIAEGRDADMGGGRHVFVEPS